MFSPARAEPQSLPRGEAHRSRAGQCAPVGSVVGQRVLPAALGESVCVCVYGCVWMPLVLSVFSALKLKVLIVMYVSPVDLSRTASIGLHTLF